MKIFMSKYQLHNNVLGKGAFGKVNLGLHRLTRKLVAIKSTTKDHMKEESMKRKMQ